MSKIKPIPNGILHVQKGGMLRRVEDVEKGLGETRQLMHYVVVVLLIMVAGMIFSLQIAIWGSRESKEPRVWRTQPFSEQHFPAGTPNPSQPLVTASASIPF